MEQNIYHIPYLPRETDTVAIDWSTVPVAEVGHFLWLSGYAPKTTAQMVYIQDYGFLLRMTCAETEPLARYHAYMDPVYTDSCMEFFADWLGDGRYINMEMNANGALLSAVGSDRHERTPIAIPAEGRIFPVEACAASDRWSVTAAIPLALLSRILGSTVEVSHGFTFRGNFYKCGDETAIPHYGMWNPVGTEKPDFHRPEYFGKLSVD